MYFPWLPLKAALLLFNYSFYVNFWGGGEELMKRKQLAVNAES
jgi:hypothetical protein